MKKEILKVYKKTVSIGSETPIGIYQALVGEGKGFLLESYDKNYDRYTFIGCAPRAIVTSGANSLKVAYRDGTVETRKGNPQTLLKNYYDEFDVERDNENLPFAGGLVGSIGYDYIRYTEELPDTNPDTIGVETIALMLVTECIMIDHFSETMTAIILEDPTPEGKIRAEETAVRLLAGAQSAQAGEEPAEAVLDGRIMRKSDTIGEYSEKVEKIKHYIREGHVFQTVLSQRWDIETGQSGFDLYRQLRKLNPSPYLYYFNFEEFEVIGSSPEMLVKKHGGTVTTCPIAGTRPRGKTKEEDRQLTDELLADEKETAEHVMLVDLARNDMGRIAEFGTVKVTEFKSVKYYSHVMHIVSFVEGIKKEGIHPMDLISSFLPAGTLSGAPKIRAMEIIDELETLRRGLYGGVCGYLDFSGDMDFCITIRTMIKVGRMVYLQAGAGIVADSVPENEYYECCNKVMALAKTLVKEEHL